MRVAGDPWKNKHGRHWNFVRGIASSSPSSARANMPSSSDQRHGLKFARSSVSLPTEPVGKVAIPKVRCNGQCHSWPHTRRPAPRRAQWDPRQMTIAIEDGVANNLPALLYQSVIVWRASQIRRGPDPHRHQSIQARREMFGQISCKDSSIHGALVVGCRKQDENGVPSTVP